MRRYLLSAVVVFSAMVVLTGLIISAFAFVANDEYRELIGTRGATQRPMHLLALISRDLRAEASTAGINPAEFDMSIRMRIMITGAFGLIVAASGVAAPIVFHRSKPPQCR